MKDSTINRILARPYVCSEACNLCLRCGHIWLPKPLGLENLGKEKSCPYCHSSTWKRKYWSRREQKMFREANKRAKVLARIIAKHLPPEEEGKAVCKALGMVAKNDAPQEST